MKGMVMSIEPDIAYEPVGIVSDGKKAHSCCKCCCDIRRAVIIVDIILLIGRAMVMLGIESALKMQMSQGSMNVGANTTEVDVVDPDDEVGVAVSVILFFLLGVWCAGLSLYGAITYNKYMVAANAIFLVLTMPFGGLLSIVVNGLYIYPHAFLIYYIHTGVITKDNYVNEKQSCCCV